MTDDQKNSVSPQLREAREPANIPLAEAELLVQMVGSVVCSYLPGGDNIAYISSAKPLTQYLIAARTTLSLPPPTSGRRIPLIPLLKLATYRMTSRDRSHMAFFGHIVIKNGIKIPRSMKRDASKFADIQTSMDLQDLLALPNTKKSFSICVRLLASTTELLVHPSTITPAELMELFCNLAELYELYDRRVSVASLVNLYKDHVTEQFTRLRTCALKKDSELPPWINIITSELRLALN